MVDESPWAKEFSALPIWAQEMVTAARGLRSHGFSDDNHAFVELASGEAVDRWSLGLDGLLELAAAMSAPWPRLTFDEVTLGKPRNLVEMIFGDDWAFDQKCAFGRRVGGHAVYCSNDAWEGSPRKCRRGEVDYLHEDCPGYVRNPSI